MPRKANFHDPVYRLVTAEAVRAGHPDKLCDQIADAILDAHLKEDPNARVAVEVLATCGKFVIAGEITSKAEVDYKNIVSTVLARIGYKKSDYCKPGRDTFEIEIRTHEQSPDIAQAVDGDVLGAGDQGIMVGYATNETPEFMPVPIVVAQNICREIDARRDRIEGLCADGKAQVTVLYEDDQPIAITNVVVSVQHAEDANLPELRSTILTDILLHVIPDDLWIDTTEIHINESGPFVLGGPAADTGLTGRKLAVDQYGPVAHIGGGAFSGKDATKVDRSGAYMARHIAKSIVAFDLASRCEVQLAYCIGQPEPVSVTIDTMGTGMYPDDVLAQAVQDTFKMDVETIIKRFDLRKPIYAPLAAYGHFGRTDATCPWEKNCRNPYLLAACLNRLIEAQSGPRYWLSNRKGVENV